MSSSLPDSAPDSPLVSTLSASLFCGTGKDAGKEIAESNHVASQKLQLSDGDEDEVVIVFERVHFGTLPAQVKQEEPNAARDESTFAEDSVSIAQQNANEISNIPAPEGNEAAAAQTSDADSAHESETATTAVQRPPTQSEQQPLFSNPAEPTTGELQRLLERIAKLKNEKLDEAKEERILVLKNASKIGGKSSATDSDVTVCTAISKVKPFSSDGANVNRQQNTVQAPVRDSAVQIPGLSMHANAARRTNEEQLWQNTPDASWHNVSESPGATVVVLPDQRPVVPAGQSAPAIDDEATVFWQRYDSGEINFLPQALEAPNITTSHNVTAAAVASPSAASNQQNLPASSLTDNSSAPNSQSCPLTPNLKLDGKPKVPLPVTDEASRSWPDTCIDIIDLTLEESFNEGLQQSPISESSVDVEASEDEVINRKCEETEQHTDNVDDDDMAEVYRGRRRHRLALDSTDTESDNGEISAMSSVQRRRRKRGAISKRKQNPDLVARTRQNSVKPEAALEESQFLLTANFKQLGINAGGELPTMFQHQIPGSSAASNPSHEGEVSLVLVEPLSAETIKRYAKSLQKKKKNRKAKEHRAVKLIRGGSKLSNGRFKCSTCNKVYKTWTGFRTHRSVHEDSRPFGCSVCLRTYRIKDCLKEHLKTHSGSRYSCNRCTAIFASSKGLENHLRNHSDRRPFKCRFCARKFKQRSVWRQHERLHTGERPFRCSECPKSYASGASLFCHQQTHGSTFLCDQCPRSFKLASSLAYHRATHSETRPFQCWRCPKSFKRNAELQKHLRLHDGQRPHACQLCTYKATTRSSLRSHVKTHTDGHTFVCAKCEKRYASKQNLQLHLAAHLEKELPKPHRHQQMGVE